MILKKSMTFRFVATVFIILLLGQAAGSVLLIMNVKGALLDSLEKRMTSTAAMTAGVSAGPVLSNEYAIIETFVDEILKDDAISSVHILDSNSRIIHEKIKSDDTDLKTVNPFLFKKMMMAKAPITAGGGALGEVIIDYNAKSINQSLSRSMIIILLFQGIMLLLIGLGMVLLFNRNIKRPVLKINRTLEKITMGDLSADVPDLGDNEIGSIAKGIAFLAERLSMTISKLNSTAVNVAMAIKQVDITYKNAISGIKHQTRAVSDMMQSVREANKAHAEIISSTEKLSGFSAENVSSLLEMKATAEEIASHTEKLYRTTENYYSVVLQISHVSKAITSNSSDMMASIEDTSASVEEIGASVREVEEHSKESAKLAERVKEITSDTGMLSVVNAVEGMDTISDEVKKSSEIIQKLGIRSLDIEKVLSVIKEVTEQTNLLSLNAAILAAQAGEYGKSFSVVADEIRALSERTANSTREISGIVKAIQKDIKDAVNAVNSAQVQVGSGNALVLKVGEALREVLTASEHSSNMTKAIERATEEQSIGLKQITVAIEEVRKMMNRIALSINEQGKAVSHLLEGVGEVKGVADITKRGTGEQAIGTKIISKNIELASDRLAQINHAVMNQKAFNDNLAAAIEQIGTIGGNTAKDMEEVSHFLGTLFEEIEILKREMEVFKIK